MNHTGQPRHPMHSAPFVTPLRRICQCILHVSQGSNLYAWVSISSIGRSSRTPSRPINTPTTPDMTSTGRRTPMHGRLSIINHEVRHHMYRKDNRIITKYVIAGHAMPSARLYSNLDLIGILSLNVIIYDSPRNRVPLCILYTYKRGHQGKK